MTTNFRTRGLALVASIALLGGTAVVASGSTGAYFSDTHSGTITGTIGSILLSTDSPTSISFTNLLPGTPQTVQVNYHNSGNSPEDVYLGFNNLTALSALNNLGRFGHVVITSDGQGSVGSVFSSYNLNDNLTSCGSFSHSIPTGPTTSTCWPVTTPLMLAGNVQPGASEDFTFTFEYASAIGNNGGNGPGVWNTYPAAGGQFYTNSGDGTGNGLPFQLVATQVGITPGQMGTKF